MTSYVFALDEDDGHGNEYEARIGLWHPKKGLISEMWATGKDVFVNRGLEKSGRVLVHFDPQPDGYEVVQNPREDPRTKAYFSPSTPSDAPKAPQRGYARLPAGPEQLPTSPFDRLLIDPALESAATPARIAHITSWNDAVRACTAVALSTQ